MTLAQESCASLGKDAAALSAAEAGALWGQVKGWALAGKGGIRRLEKSFGFPDFKKALAFAVRLGKIADQQDHHPELLVEWGKATVSWWTHAVKGLHRNDFIMAAKTDAAARLTAPREIAKLKKS